MDICEVCECTPCDCFDQGGGNNGTEYIYKHCIRQPTYRTCNTEVHAEVWHGRGPGNCNCHSTGESRTFEGQWCTCEQTGIDQRQTDTCHSILYTTGPAEHEETKTTTTNTSNRTDRRCVHKSVCSQVHKVEPTA